MSLGFRSESTLVLRKSKPLDVTGSNEGLSSLSSQISSRALSLQAQTRKRSRGSKDQRTDGASSSSKNNNTRGSSSSSTKHRDGKQTKPKDYRLSDSINDSKDEYGRSKGKRRKSGVRSEREERPNAGVEARAALDKDPSRKEKEKLRMKALERKARLYDQLRGNNNNSSARDSEDVGGGLVDFGRKAAAQLGEDYEEEYSLRNDEKRNDEQQEEIRNHAHYYNYDAHNTAGSRRDTHDQHTDHQPQLHQYSSGHTLDETRRDDGPSNSNQFRNNVVRGTEAAATVSAAKGFAVRQRYEFGLTAREKAFLPEVAAETADSSAAVASSAREDRRAKLMQKLQRS